ncbi:MAG: hypothetical protein KGJ12_06730 [Gammaproteobacteria bacterium]|nr:hypothetical protein [Gammaproteobacteria bacterium]
MNKTTRYLPEVQERSVRLVLEHPGERESQWAALAVIEHLDGSLPGVALRIVWNIPSAIRVFKY